MATYIPHTTDVLLKGIVSKMRDEKRKKENGGEGGGTQAELQKWNKYGII